MIKRIDHVAIIVKNLDESLALFGKLYNLKATRIEKIADQGVRSALVPVGDGEIELIEPIDPSSGVAKFLEKRGEGLHHISLEVDDVDQELKAMEKRGAELIDKKGRPGMAGKIAFLHPRSTRGVLVELSQKVGSH